MMYAQKNKMQALAELRAYCTDYCEGYQLPQHKGKTP
jgi:hypothetical protein